MGTIIDEIKHLLGVPRVLVRNDIFNKVFNLDTNSSWGIRESV